MTTTTTNRTWSEKLASVLVNAATDIGELQVQIALGKAEAHDKYEALRKNLQHKIHTMKSESHIGENIGHAEKEIESAFKKLDKAFAAMLG